jgi:hypothetical protein
MHRPVVHIRPHCCIEATALTPRYRYYNIAKEPPPNLAIRQQTWDLAIRQKTWELATRQESWDCIAPTVGEQTVGVETVGVETGVSRVWRQIGRRVEGGQIDCGDGPTWRSWIDLAPVPSRWASLRSTALTRGREGKPSCHLREPTPSGRPVR